MAQVEVGPAGAGGFVLGVLFGPGEGAVGDEVEVGAVFGGAEDGALDLGRFAAGLGGEVGEPAFEAAGFGFDDGAFVEVGLAGGFGAGVGGEAVEVGEEDAGAVGGGELEDGFAALAFGAAGFAGVELEGFTARHVAQVEL